VTAPKECRAVQLAVARLHKPASGLAPSPPSEAVQEVTTPAGVSLNTVPWLRPPPALSYRTYCHRGQKKASVRICTVSLIEVVKFREAAGAVILKIGSDTDLPPKVTP